ncbi:hypothetical protein PB2503_12669 [Parvularcula bermudensis HTCC2503]|uniref:DNA-binding response regulator PetR n=1 Tax=Parvularcula bermudensis (strain ATCC BAA-594 / HTCC2503 / KCTC 12087) TaxID=314260 RepID=E0TFL1_PARBH|nr:response regulator [Parvularcula bermudensis]ADM10571.1 hypothetical protein PB2503_12669 [Parvularcula bermudensis HTCC2503]
MSSDGTPSHILVVDDDDRLRSLTARYLRENAFLTSSAASAEAADRLMTLFHVDALVLDVMMPGEDGIAMTTRLRRHTNTPILLLTARGQPEDRIAGLEAGADDYLPKPFEPRELVLRLRRLVDRKDAPPKDQPLRFGDHEFHPRRGELKRGNETIKLTGAELSLLRVLANRPGAPFDRQTLAEQTGSGVDRSIDVQVNRLRRKIEDDPRTPFYLQTVRGVGYMLVVD